VTLAAVAAILGSALFVLMGLVMLLNVFLPTPQAGMPPSSLKAISVVLCFVMLGFAAWGITTALGLFRLRSWSRWSILVFSTLLAFMGGATALVMAFIPLPPAPGASPEVMTGVKIALVVIYGVPAVMGAFRLFYFNTARVRTMFELGVIANGPGHRPLSISVIAWLLLSRGVIYVGGIFLPLPGMAFGLILAGWPARASYFILAAIEISLGLGLLRLNRLSRVLAIGLFDYGILNSLLFAILLRYSEDIRAALDVTLREPSRAMLPLAAALSVGGSLIGLIPIGFLIARRQAFIKPPALPQF
jgi:hypothetical protein